MPSALGDLMPLVAEPMPDLSVVVPSVNGWALLAPSLAAVAAQTGDLRIETLVADRVGEAVREPLRDQFPNVRVLEADAGATIPELRALAFRAARAPVVGVIEDHVIVAPDWASRMVAAHHEGAEVVGGSIENVANDRLVDWAAFHCEYSHCLEPLPAGPAPWVAGNNVTYRRALLERFADVVERGGWEYELHAALQAAGIVLESRPEIRVGHRMLYRHAGDYAGQRFLYSRSFAALRLRDRPLGTRLAYGLAALALPPVLFARVVTRVWRTGRHRTRLLGALPMLVLFVVAWAAGEAVGAWRGAGDALGRVR